MSLPLLESLQLGLDLANVGLLLVELLQALLEQIGFEFGTARLFPAAVGQQIVLPQLEHVGQNLLALAGTLQGEGIRLSLSQIGGVNKGLVVEAELTLNGLLGGAHAAAG